MTLYNANNVFIKYVKNATIFKINARFVDNLMEKYQKIHYLISIKEIK
jgi:hypothetical protein